MEEDSIITLIGVRMAKQGTEFIFRGKAADCNGCKFKNTCLNLDTGMRYKIVGVRNAPALECSIHDMGVQAVEVVKVPITAVIESRIAYNGSTIIYEPLDCDEDECEILEICQNTALNPGNKYTIVKIEGIPKVGCKKGYSLKEVQLKK